MLKKTIVLLVLLFVAGVLTGRAYDWLFSYRDEAFTKNSLNASNGQTETVSSAGSIASDSSVAVGESAPDGKAQRVTNPDKICSTPGCGNAVFVTYKGKELCVKCYGEAKIQDTKNQKTN